MYVERKTLLAEIDEERKYLIELGMCGAEDVVVHHARRFIEDAPAADVAPVIYGEWVNVVHALVDTTGNCTKCGKQAVWRTKNKPYIICPNCGAKMK